MAAEKFGRIMDHVFAHEGGYSDHAIDPGGATNMGVTHATLAAWRGRPVTKDDVRALTKGEARDIYRALYWNVIRGDDLPVGIDLCVMDAAVNSGPARAARWLQVAVGSTVDGVIGSQTLAAARTADPATAIGRMCDARLAFLRRLSTWPTFGNGWSRRVEAVRTAALAMAEQSTTGDGDMPTREDIAAVQRALNLHGFGLAEDGFYGPKTAAAIRAFQRAHRLKVDGIAGPETLAALGVAAKPAAPVETVEPGKSLLRSRTFWGVIVSAVGKAAAVAGYDLGFDEDAAVSLILLCVSFVGDAIALWGRLKATTTVKARPGA